MTARSVGTGRALERATPVCLSVAELGSAHKVSSIRDECVTRIVN
jgi:hypothetical protein